MELDETLAAQIPQEIRDHEFVKNAPDMPTLIKRAVDTHGYVGRSIQLPAKDTNLDEWRGKTAEKLQQHGFTLTQLQDLPPDDPSKYEIKWGENAASLAPEIEQGLRAVALEAKVNNASLQKFVDFYQKVNNEVVAKSTMTPEMIEKETREIVGNDYDQVMGKVQSARQALISMEASNKEALEGDSIKVVETLPDGSVKVYPYGRFPFTVAMLELIGEQNLDGDQGGNIGRSGVPIEKVGEDAAREANDIIANPSNPKHVLFQKGDRATHDYVQGLFAKAYPGVQEK